MDRAQDNSDDPGLLISRSLDDDLSDDERRRLDEALTSSDTLRREADRLSAVHDLVRRWGERPAELDWTAHAKLVLARCAAKDEPESDAALDRTLEHWAMSPAGFDEDRFTSSVMDRVKRHASRAHPPTWYGRIIRLGTPLVAAAALGFAIINGLWFSPGSVRHDPVCEVVVARPRSLSSSAESNEGAAPAIVRFSREPDRSNAWPRASNAGGIAFTAVGVASGKRSRDQAVP